MRKQKFFLFFLQASIFTCGVSISISQAFLFLSFLLFWTIPEKRELKTGPLLWSGLAIFGMYFFSFLLHSGDREAWTVFFSKQSEFKDLLIFAAFLVTHNLSSEEIEKVKKAFYSLIGVLILTGLISIFSKIRLSILISELFRTVTNWRFTHHYGDILGIGIHLPIGLMNTHLTFGGLLMLFAPFVFFQFLEVFKRKENGKERLSIIAIGISFLLVFLLNNARSALFGMLISVCFGLYDYVFVKKGIDPKRFLKVAGFSFAIIGMGIAFLLSFEPTAKTIRPLLGAEKHTDSGRTFIWDSSYPLVKNNFFTGVMPGMYNKEIEKTRLMHSEAYPELAYFYEVTQRGHAHNDLLHLFAIAGIGAVLAFLSLLYFIQKTILEHLKYTRDSILFYGLVGFFFAGLLQCYFQDDEVVIVFWFLIGLLNSISLTNRIDDSNKIER